MPARSEAECDSSTNRSAATSTAARPATQTGTTSNQTRAGMPPAAELTGRFLPAEVERCETSAEAEREGEQGQVADDEREAHLVAVHAVPPGRSVDARTRIVRRARSRRITRTGTGDPSNGGTSLWRGGVGAAGLSPASASGRRPQANLSRYQPSSGTRVVPKREE